MQKKVNVLFATIIASAVIAWAPVMAQEDEVDAYLREQIEAQQEREQSRRELVKRLNARYGFQEKYMADGD